MATSNYILYTKALALSVPALDGWLSSAVFKLWIGNGVFLISLSREITFSAGEVVGGFRSTVR